MEWKDIDDAVFLIPAEDLFDFDRRDEPRTARITGYVLIRVENYPDYGGCAR